MKAMFCLELIGNSIRQEFEDFERGLCNSKIIYKQIPQKPYVKEIICFNKEKSGYHLYELIGRRDYSDSNGSGNRGIKKWYLLESGHNYIVKKQITWTRCEISYITINNHGDIITLSKDELNKNIPEYINVQKPDDCPFCGIETNRYNNTYMCCHHEIGDYRECTKNILSHRKPTFCPMK